MAWACGFFSTLLTRLREWRSRKSRGSKDVETYDFQNLRSARTVETVASSTTPPRAPTRSYSSRSIVAAPSLAELQRTAPPKTPPRGTPSPVHPTRKSPQLDASTASSRPRHIPITDMYPYLGAKKPLFPVPEASVAGPLRNPPPVNPAYAAAHARREMKAMEKGDTNTDFLLENDEDSSTTMSLSNADHGSTVVHRPSREEELARRLSILKKPPGPRIANLLGQDRDWGGTGIAPLPSPPVSTQNVRQIPPGESIVSAPFDPYNPPRRSSLEGLRYLNDEHSLYWEQPGHLAPVRPPRRSSLEWAARQEKLRRQLTSDRLRPQREQEYMKVKKRKSFSDWVQDRASQDIAEEGEEEEEEEQQNKTEEPVLLQPTVYTPSTPKDKGKAKAEISNRTTAGSLEGRMKSSLQRTAPQSPLLPPAPSMPAHSATAYVRTRERPKDPKLYERVSQSDFGNS